MSEPVTNPPPVTTTVDPNATTPPPKAAETTTAPPEQPKKPAGKNVTLPESAMKRIKDEERAKGAKAELNRLNAEAQKHGFKDHAALMAFAANKGRPAAQPAKPKTDDSTAAPTGDMAAMEKRVKAAELAASKAAKLAEVEKQQRKELSRKHRLATTRADAAEAETSIRIGAFKRGATESEIDYIVHSLKQAVRGKTEEELKGFDEDKWMDDFKAARPNLFGSTTAAPAPRTPVTTGPTTTTAPTQKTTDAPPRFDAMKATRAELVEHYRKIGRPMPQV